MGLLDFLKRTKSADEMAGIIARASITVLTDPDFNVSVLDPVVSSGQAPNRSRVHRELMYFVHFANHVAIAASLRDSTKATALVQMTTDVLIPTWASLELKRNLSAPLASQDMLLPPIVTEYTAKKEAMVSAFESAPAGASLPERTEVLAAMTLRESIGSVPSNLVPALVALWIGHYQAASRALQSTRLAWS